MSLEIRLLRDDEHQKAVDFYNSAKSVDHKIQRDKRNYDGFEWEFMNGPFGKAIYVVAVEILPDGLQKIVGTQCAIPIMMCDSKGNKILSAKPEDTYLDITAQLKYRKRDILGEMFELLVTECKKIEIHFFWGFTMVTSTFKRVGFSTPFTSFHGLLVSSPISAYKYLSKRNPNNRPIDLVKIFGLSIVSYFLGLKRKFILSSSDLKVIDKEINNELFYKDTKNQYSGTFYSIFQTDEYLSWRIFQNPSGIQYKLLQFKDRTENYVGEIIYSYKEQVAFIDQMAFCATASPKTKGQAISLALCDILKNKEISIIRFAGYKHNSINMSEISLLEKFGFLFINKGTYFVFRNISDMDIKPEQIILSRLYTQGINQ